MNEIGEFHTQEFIFVACDARQNATLDFIIPTYALFNPSLGGVYYAYDKKV